VTKHIVLVEKELAKKKMKSIKDKHHFMDTTENFKLPIYSNTNHHIGIEGANTYNELFMLIKDGRSMLRNYSQLSKLQFCSCLNYNFWMLKLQAINC
jgi:hypothetical protein